MVTEWRAGGSLAVQPQPVTAGGGRVTSHRGLCLHRGGEESRAEPLPGPSLQQHQPQPLQGGA